LKGLELPHQSSVSEAGTNIQQAEMFDCAFMDRPKPISGLRPNKRPQLQIFLVDTVTQTFTTQLLRAEKKYNRQKGQMVRVSAPSAYKRE
jgi:hypothetical protein